VSPQKDPKDAPGEAEGWESLVEEASDASIAPSQELEEAMREAAEAIEARSTSPEPVAGLGPPEAGKPGDELEALQDRYIRLQADFDNFRKRVLKEREEAHAFGHQNLVKDLLPTVDNLERAIQHLRQSQAADLEGLLHGVELVERELLQALAKHGVVAIDADEKPFDPAFHEAVAQVEDETLEEGSVVQVVQRGYLLRDRLLRPAGVIVSKKS
jgi:molecular chaperone GrpE